MIALTQLIRRGRGGRSRSDVAQAVSALIGDDFHQQRLYRLEKGSEPDFGELEALVEVLKLDEKEVWDAYRRDFGTHGIRKAMDWAITSGDPEKARMMLDLLIAA